MAVFVKETIDMFGFPALRHTQWTPGSLGKLNRYPRAHLLFWVEECSTTHLCSQRADLCTETVQDRPEDAMIGGFPVLLLREHGYNHTQD